MSDYLSNYKLNKEKYLNQLTADASLLSGWIDDTLEPSVNIMQLQVGLSELMGLLEAKQLTPTILRAELLRLMELSRRLDKIATQNATAQIRLKHADIELQKKRFDDLPDFTPQYPVCIPTPDRKIPRVDNL